LCCQNADNDYLASATQLRSVVAFRWHGTAATDSRLPWDYPMDKKGPQRQATKALSASGHAATHKFVAT
jgi:hypothetical protein